MKKPVKKETANRTTKYVDPDGSLTKSGKDRVREVALNCQTIHEIREKVPQLPVGYSMDRALAAYLAAATKKSQK